jgi:hypothetical protein
MVYALSAESFALISITSSFSGLVDCSCVMNHSNVREWLGMDAHRCASRSPEVRVMLDLEDVNAVGDRRNDSQYMVREMWVRCLSYSTFHPFKVSGLRSYARTAVVPCPLLRYGKGVVSMLFPSLFQSLTCCSTIPAALSGVSCRPIHSTKSPSGSIT